MHSSFFLQAARALVACGVVVCLSGAFTVGFAGPSTGSARARVQRVLDELRIKLEIDERITVTIERDNSLLMSVEPVAGTSAREFQLKVEEGFVSELDDAQLLAAVAHELGHVWIFTHHPFLQTEQLANEIAMRLVSRDALAQLYDRVWSRRGTKGDLARFLGPLSQAGLASSDAQRP